MNSVDYLGFVRTIAHDYYLILLVHCPESKISFLRVGHGDGGLLAKINW